MPRRSSPLVLAAASVALLGLTGLTAGSALAASNQTVPQTQAAIDASAIAVQSPEAKATEQAITSNLPVEIPALENEKTAVYAQPDGTVKASLFNGPSLVVRNGQWVRMDGTLRSTGSSVVPAVTKADLAFSSGGSASSAASLGTPAGPVGLGWLSKLPTPSLSGPVATYSDVLPGADLKVTARPTGFELSLVLKTRLAASLGTLRLPVRLPAGLHLAAQSTGGYDVVAADGTVQSVISPTVMWDAAHAPDKGGYDGEHPVDTKLVTTSGGSQELDLTPDAAFLADPKTVYPVTVDPSASLPDNLDTDVTTYCKTCNYDSSDTLHVGLSGYGTLYRSFLRFNDSAIKGKDVTSATLQLWQHDAYTCSPKPMWTVGASGMGPGTTWNTQPTSGSTNPSNSDSFNGGSFGSGSCPNNGATSLSITGLARSWSTNGYPSPEALALKAPNESDGTQWKQFYSADTFLAPHIDVTYNSYPSQPSGQAVSPCRPCSSPVAIPTLRPSLSATGTDPEGGTLRFDFEVWKGSSAAPTERAASGSASASSGSAVSWQVPSGSLVDDQPYEYRVRSFDGVDYSSWSSWKQFATNRTPEARLFSDDQLDGIAWMQSNNLTQLVAGLQSRFGDRWAGVHYFTDVAPRHASIFVKDYSQTDDDALRRDMGSQYSVLLPTKVKYSLSEIKAAQRRMIDYAATRPDGALMTGSDWNIDRNGVNADMKPGGEALVASMQLLVGADMIYPVNSDTRLVQEEGRDDGRGQWKAGKIWTTPERSGSCSSGFVWSYTPGSGQTEYYGSSAGHCSGEDGYGAYLGSGSNRQLFGTNFNNIYQAERHGRGYVTNDVQFVRGSTATNYTPNLIFVSDDKNITRKVVASEQGAMGLKVCRSGYETGVRCDAVDQVGKSGNSTDYDDSGVRYEGLTCVGAGAVSDGGDSGAPYYESPPEGGDPTIATAVGMHVTGRFSGQTRTGACFSELSSISNATGYSVLTQ